MKPKQRQNIYKFQTSALNALAPSTINLHMETESNMKMNDQVMVETLERKNDLESYIYNMRAEL